MMKGQDGWGMRCAHMSVTPGHFTVAPCKSVASSNNETYLLSSPTCLYVALVDVRIPIDHFMAPINIQAA